MKTNIKIWSNFRATFRFCEQRLGTFLGNFEQLYKEFGASCGQP